MAHAITLTSSLGSRLLFANMTAREALGRLFEYQLEMLSKNVQVDLRALLGTPMTVKLVTPQGYTRYFNGMVCAAEQAGFVDIDNVRYAVYKATLVPRPWLLTRKIDCRIYKGLSVPQIIRTVLSELGYGDVQDRLSGHYPTREYCVQYQESYFDFISRLMEQEGIYYFFTHTQSTHTMVLADALGAHSTVASFEHIPYAPPTERGHRIEASISEWEWAKQVQATKVQLDDYDYMHPKASLLAGEELSDAADRHGIDGLDIYDYPYDDQGDTLDVASGQRRARVRADALNVPLASSRGVTDACGLAVGALFTLKDFPLADANREYLVVSASTRLVEPDYMAGGGGSDQGESPFHCRFEVIGSQQPFRTMQTTPRPLIAGLQTARVHGTTAEDIAVDKYGRVQVTFFWNRPGKPGADASCPVRVAQCWAGKRWGAQFIPRVGQEVVVSFLEGHPDRPLIIGSVYNADNMPPYALPEHKARSGVRSRSLHGGSEDYNEIRFDDTNGEEQLLVHAQNDMREESEHDHQIKVGHDFRLEAAHQIELVTGASRLVMKHNGDIELHGTRLTLDAAVGVELKGGVDVRLEAGAHLSIDSKAAVDIRSMATTLVQSQSLELVGSTLASLTGGALIIA